MKTEQKEAGRKAVTVPAAPATNKARRIDVQMRKGVSEDRIVAELALGAVISNASTALDYSKMTLGEMDLQECREVMEADIKAVNGGNLDKLEGMLTAQAMALDAMFNNFAKRAIHAQYVSQMDTFTRMAMKAQSQCRTTVEAIAEIKYPKSATFIKQANIAQQQQVNNATPPRAPEKDITPTNELLTEPKHAALDAGRAGAAISLNPELETVGAVNRAH